jgi:PAS domain S-box-containing protein
MGQFKQIKQILCFSEELWYFILLLGFGAVGNCRGPAFKPVRNVTAHMSPEFDRPTSAPQFPSEFRTLVEDFRAILWEIDCGAHRFTWVSRHAEEVLGYPVSDWLDKPNFWDDHIHPADRESVLASCQRVEAGAEDHQFEYRMIAASGQILWFRHIVRMVKDSHGRAVKLRGVMVDITEQRAAEQALRDSEERLRKVFYEGPVAMSIVGPDFRVKAVNQAFCTMLGMEEHDFKKMTTAEFIHPDDRAERADMILQLFAGTIPSYRAQKRYINARGETIWADVFGTLVRDASGNPLYVLGIAVDITAHKRAERDSPGIVRALDAFAGRGAAPNRTGTA